MTRPIDISALSPELQRALRAQAGWPETPVAEGVTLCGKATRSRGQRDERAIAKKRGKTGHDFEAELNFTHRYYEFQKIGKLWPHAPPFVFVKGKWQPKAGGGPVDRTGHVCVSVSHETVGVRWRGCSIDDVLGGEPGAFLQPIAFDAKVQNDHSATYKHDKKRQHQLHQLRDASAVGVAAFLLVSAPKVARVFLIPIENHFSDLISGRGVTLYETRRREVLLVNDWPHLCEPLLPSIQRTHPAGWDWIPLLQWCPAGRESLI